MQSNQVQTINVPEEERSSRIPSAETVGAAVSLLQRDGIVVLKQVVELDAVKTINKILVTKAEDLASDPATHFNQTKAARNISQPPPTTPELMFDTLWANPFAAAVSAAILGPRPRVHYANGNTALQSTERQTVHADLDHNHLRFPFAIVANFYMTDTSATNGSTEIWVGSHRDTSVADHVDTRDAPGGLSTIRPELVEARRARVPPVQPVFQAGDLVLRDVRLWHAGMPNRTCIPRVMLAFVIFPWWYKPLVRLSLPAEAKPLVHRWTADTGLEYDVHWLDGENLQKEFFVTLESANHALAY
ncbi:phytanoyl-CoA dioxygenase family protein [Dothidotthia symphoricarpi CBS 119687]|uniref:Phytanoyl-CoA dioxygenase family protein n=1 Tax=Dothidotthia symphoricarpi CBS 119687 TaxID=1392245 RepID=A0A6A6ABL7_9PLEO|nr:phytanoyl-CoA dioxygenase family protein [Dothidotthia symphoricarpi CBS 119687]KAF2128278.1 phytanoyl-CoA dioxygenase family protein [Dothidotthia symphoricarpi CBS 119687]